MILGVWYPTVCTWVFLKAFPPLSPIPHSLDGTLVLFATHNQSISFIYFLHLLPSHIPYVGVYVCLYVLLSVCSLLYSCCYFWILIACAVVVLLYVSTVPLLSTSGVWWFFFKASLYALGFSSSGHSISFLSNWWFSCCYWSKCVCVWWVFQDVGMFMCHSVCLGRMLFCRFLAFTCFSFYSICDVFTCLQSFVFCTRCFISSLCNSICVVHTLIVVNAEYFIYARIFHLVLLFGYSDNVVKFLVYVKYYLGVFLQ